MARIPVHTLNSAPEASRAYIAGLERKMGRLRNMHAEMAHSPVVIAAYQGIQQAIADHGTFDAHTREAIALAVANQNSCEYCESAHAISAGKAGLTDEQIIEVRAGEVGFDNRLAAITELARAAAADTGYVPESVWQTALEAGWSDTELAEAFAHVAANVYTNYFNHYAYTELDIPAAEPLSD